MNVNLTVLVLVACLLIGCRRDAGVSQDSFQLAVTPVLNDAGQKIWILTISAKPNACISIDCDEFHAHTVLPDSKDMVPESGLFFISTTRIAPNQSTSAYVKTLIRPYTADHIQDMPILDTVSTNTSLEDVFSFIASNGIYQIDSPVIIAKIQDTPVTLVVGKCTQTQPNTALEATADSRFHLMTTNGFTTPSVGSASAFGR